MPSNIILKRGWPVLAGDSEYRIVNMLTEITHSSCLCTKASEGIAVHADLVLIQLQNYFVYVRNHLEEYVGHV